MAVEKSWLAVPARNLIADGGEYGEIQVSSTEGFKVKQIVIIKSDTQQSKFLEVKRVVDNTLMFLGPSGKISERSDITAYTTADNAVIYAKEQRRPKISPEEYERASYEEEPTVAKRTISVDKLGRFWSESNPFPVHLSDGSVNIGTVNAEMEVQLSRRDNYPDSGDIHDSTRIGNQDYELSFTTNDNESKAAADVSILNNLIDIPHDEIEITQFTSDGDPEIIEIKENGTLKRTLTLSYNADGNFQKVVRS